MGNEINQEIEAKLARFLELKPFVSEFEKIKRELKPLFQGVEQMNIGPYLITGKEQSRSGYYTDPYTYWDLKVIKIGETVTL